MKDSSLICGPSFFRVQAKQVMHQKLFSSTNFISSSSSSQPCHQIWQLFLLNTIIIWSSEWVLLYKSRLLTHSLYKISRFFFTQKDMQLPSSWLLRAFWHTDSIGKTGPKLYMNKWVEVNHDWNLTKRNVKLRAPICLSFITSWQMWPSL